MTKVDPSPGALRATQIRPPWYSSTIRLARVIPSPQPRCLVVNPGAKTSFISAGDIPFPWSLMRTSTDLGLPAPHHLHLDVPAAPVGGVDRVLQDVLHDPLDQLLVHADRGDQLVALADLDVLPEVRDAAAEVAHRLADDRGDVLHLEPGQAPDLPEAHGHLLQPLGVVLHLVEHLAEEDLRAAPPCRPTCPASTCRSRRSSTQPRSEEIGVPSWWAVSLASPIQIARCSLCLMPE